MFGGMMLRVQPPKKNDGCVFEVLAAIGAKGFYLYLASRRQGGLVLCLATQRQGFLCLWSKSALGFSICVWPVLRSMPSLLLGGGGQRVRGQPGSEDAIGAFGWFLGDFLEIPINHPANPNRGAACLRRQFLGRGGCS